MKMMAVCLEEKLLATETGETDALEGWRPRPVAEGGGRADEGTDSVVRVEIPAISEVEA